MLYVLIPLATIGVIGVLDVAFFAGQIGVVVAKAIGRG